LQENPVTKAKVDQNLVDLNTFAPEGEQDTAWKGEIQSPPAAPVDVEQPLGVATSATLPAPERVSVASQHANSPPVAQTEAVVGAYLTAVVCLDAPMVAQTAPSSVLELPQSQVRATVPSTIQRDDEYGLQTVNEERTSDEAFGADSANDDHFLIDGALDHVSSSNSTHMNPPAASQTALLSVAQPWQMQVLVSVPPSSGQQSTVPATQTAVDNAITQGGRERNDTPESKGRWSWVNRRGPRPQTGVLTPIDFIRDKQAYLRNQSGYEKAHAEIAKCSFKYGCKSGPFSTREDGKGDFVAIITLNHLNKYRKTNPAYRNQPALNGHPARKDWYDNHTTKSERDAIRVFVMEKVEEEIAKTHPTVWAEVQRLRRTLPAGNIQVGPNPGMSTMNPQLGGGLQSSVAIRQIGGGGVSGRTPRPLAPSGGSRLRIGGDSGINRDRQHVTMASRTMRTQQGEKRRREVAEEAGDDDFLQNSLVQPQEKKLKIESEALGNVEAGWQNIPTAANNGLGFQRESGTMDTEYASPSAPYLYGSAGSFEGVQPNNIGQMAAGNEAYRPYPAFVQGGQGVSYGLETQEPYSMHPSHQFDVYLQQQGYGSDFGQFYNPHSMPNQQNQIRQPNYEPTYQDSMTQSRWRPGNGVEHLPVEMMYKYPDPNVAEDYSGSQSVDG
jgi:hypothetical protein